MSCACSIRFVGALAAVHTLALGIVVASECYPDREGTRALYYLYMILSALDLIDDGLAVRHNVPFYVYSQLEKSPASQTSYAVFIVMSSFARLASFTQFSGHGAYVAFNVLVLVRCIVILGVIASGALAGCGLACCKVLGRCCAKAQKDQGASIHPTV